MSTKPPPHLKGETPVAWAMLSPALLGLLLFVAVPFGVAAALSFTDLRLGSPLPINWVGLRQYVRLWSDETFHRALLNNALFAAGIVPVQTGLALLVALLLNRRLRAMPVFRTLFFMPVVFPMAMVAVVWELIFAPGAGGMLNRFLAMVTFGGWEPRDFLHDPHLALPALMVLSIWQGLGFQMVVLLAGLQAIPDRLYEAARIDGAGRFAQFWHVTLPGLRNPMIFVVTVTTLLALRVFDQVQILTQGGPQDATTTVMYEAVDAAFSRQQVAKACAMTVVFFVLVLAITLTGRLFVREEREVV